MGDRELLEKAAKAAGIELSWHSVEKRFYNDATGDEWSPLDDDGEALRLSVALGFEVYHTINNDRWTVFVGYPKQQRIVYVFEEWGDDEMAATRRAIVRAAAALEEPHHEG